MPASIAVSIILLLFQLLPSLPANAQQATTLLSIDRIDPPNWWVGMQYNQIELLVYGTDLAGTHVTSSDDRLRIVSVTASTNGHYLFVEIHIPTELPPATYRLLFHKADASVQFDFPVLPRNNGPNQHQGFGPEDVIYLITPDRFANGDATNDRAEDLLDEFDPAIASKRHGGDLQGVIDHLPYLDDLGVTAIWLNPVLENRGIDSYHGYKATDLYRIDPRLGTNHTYRQLVDAAHRVGIKVIFDHVNNHIGLRHPWVTDLPQPNWIHGNVDQHDREKHYLLSISDPYADPHSVQQLKQFWFVDQMPDLNLADPKLARYRIQNTLWWVEFSGLDGIREDTYPYSDQSFLATWAKTIRTEYPQLNIVGEIWATKSAYLAQFQQRTILPRDFETHLPTVMDFPLMESYRGFLSGEGKLQDIYATLAQDFLFTDPRNLLVFLDNHDTPRATWIAQNDPRRVRLALSMLLTSRGIPQLLYGTEIGMVGGEQHVELRANFPGGFPRDTRSAFTPTGRTDAEQAMYEHVRALLHIRSTCPALRTGKLIHFAPRWNDDVYKYLRISEEQTLLVIANGHDAPREVELTELRHYLTESRRLRELLTGSISPSDRSTLSIPALTCYIFELLE